MKKEARIQAEKMYLEAGGKITNRELADAVGVNPLTVGRWKREYEWDDKLVESHSIRQDTGPGVVRKKAARDKALSLYLDAGGNITNKELARKVDVSPATISKWKEHDNWIDKIVPEVPEIPEISEEAPVSEAVQGGPQLHDLVSPEQIIELNRKVDGLLTREHLTADELLSLAEAKSRMLEAVGIYLDIARDYGRISEEE